MTSTMKKMKKMKKGRRKTLSTSLRLSSAQNEALVNLTQMVTTKPAKKLMPRRSRYKLALPMLPKQFSAFFAVHIAIVILSICLSVVVSLYVIISLTIRSLLCIRESLQDSIVSSSDLAFQNRCYIEIQLKMKNSTCVRSLSILI